ncbi:MAG: bifunctional diaminohydroxyphosphoribosylaminopyrimidine deaminase/5-amino-6-(5-phosphoribosylamino)uracil reductase RibD [Acidobacteria bacterium]|nr:bifunctional diaminohydroxyphosphoribosylaminopyrimidine deaminase/5-amino-6-(5-phosphoribosylamino)uracil reductase RibD [Acidobacteriota bacterium]MBI3424190.1 bifunctional diaminohydroxyphosphoribosylaminopyrimidine deaminase/5-amino-6-(5-phosphoribosylamino)uracil reductase RibD [Acidobacteriota bacterium]
MTDPDFIQLTLDLAAQGSGLVSPNPLVGSLVVKDGAIVGRGFHRYAEFKHAEVWALEEAGAQARGATVYVNLEPCSHQDADKRTPPCVQALIDAGVKRVVAAMVDPNPRVNGRGFAQLRAAGIEVEVGVLNEAAQRLNEKFIKFVTTGLPFVLMKTACSLDGRIATHTGESKWITGEAARAASQALRHECDAILVGIGTVLADDPALTDRTGLPRHRPLTRVVLDSNLRLPLESQLVQTARVTPLIVFTSANKTGQQAQLVAAGVQLVRVARGIDGLDLPQVLRELGQRQITSLIVEGGADVAGSFVQQRLLDKASFFLAPKLLGGRAAYPAIGGAGFARLDDALQLCDITIQQHGADLELTGYPIAD